MSAENAKVVEGFLGAFSSGDVPGALSFLAPETVVDEAHGLPFSGTYVGPNGFMDILGKMSALLGAKVDRIEVFDGGDVVIGKLLLTFTSNATGEELQTTAVELYTVEDGKITHADVYYKDPGAVTALATGS